MRTGAGSALRKGTAVVATTRQEPGFGIEQRGVEWVPLTERWGTPRGLFWLWAGAVTNVEFVVYGALLVSLGLSFVQAVIIAVLGNLLYVLTGLTSLQGPKAGTTTFGVSRAPFGPNGNRVVAFFNWVTQVGFETEGVALIVLAGLALASKGGMGSSVALKVALILAAAAVQIVLPLLGHATILRVLRALAIPFVVLFVILAVLTAPKVHVHVHHSASWATMMVGAALVISGGGLGWSENASDYSRYLPPGSRPAAILGWVTAGAALPSMLLEILGAAVATGVPSATNPISGLPHAFPAWFLVPYLVVAILQLFAINTMDLYSSGVTLQALGVGLRRIHCVVIDTVVCCGLTAFAIFSRQFNTLLSDFLLFIVVWLGPWCAVFLVDWALRRGRYDSRSLMARVGGVYWRRGGVSWRALVAQGIGMVAAMMWIDTSVYVGPLSSRTQGSDLSIYLGFCVGGLVYLLLAHRQVRSEAQEPLAEPVLGAGSGAGSAVGAAYGAGSEPGLRHGG
ncbi:MAG: purine-cytosine permease family protein [Acidimicrobiales bacterium]